jgi:hypothetical protein
VGASAGEKGSTIPNVGRRRPWRILLIFLVPVAACLAGAPFLAGTRAVNEALDRRALRTMAEVAARAPVRAEPPALPYANAAALERLTHPPADELAVARAPMRRFRLGDDALEQEVLTFPSAIHLEHAESNTSTAYVYRHGRLGERPVVVWVPGQYVVDLALIPISWFTREIVRRGADVVLLVPPYHLDRTPRGFASGDAVFDTGLADHLNVFAQELSDLRRLVAWLRAQGAPAVGGFGGSVGAMLLLRMATWDRSLDFLTVFIPMLHLGNVLDGAEGEPIRARVRAEGSTVEELQRIYGALDPTAEEPGIDPKRVSVLYGRYDLVAPARATEAWARERGVSRLSGYERGHALALFTRRMYRDYARFLDEDLRALGW